MSPKVESRLRCRYITNNHPFLLLGPIKEEEAYLNPRLVVYYDVISDEEIEVVKAMAQPRVRSTYSTTTSITNSFNRLILQFQRATVQNKDSGIREPANYRISKSAWLSNYEHKYIARVCLSFFSIFSHYISQLTKVWFNIYRSLCRFLIA